MPSSKRQEPEPAEERSDDLEIVPSPALRQPWALYLGLLAFGALAALTTREMAQEWKRSLRHERSRTVFDFVQEGTPVRPTDAPGAIAWLDQQIERHVATMAGPRTEHTVSIAELTDSGPVPAPFAHLAEAMSFRGAEAECGLRWIRPEEARTTGLDLPPENGLLFRTQKYLTCAERFPAPLEEWLVLTRRKEVDTPLSDRANGSNRFLHAVAPYLYEVRNRLETALATRPLPAIAGPQPPRPVRLYALAEDSSFLSLPTTRNEAPERALDRVLAEGREFRKRPNLPSYVYNEFFFRFGEPWRPEEARYSGFYLDIAGQGLVVTLLVPQESGGERWVAALDLSLAIDWQAFARQVEAPLVAQIAEVDSARSATGGRPWTTLRAALGQRSSDPRLDLVLDELATRERRTRQEPRSIPSHQTAVVEGQGAVAAFQVYRNQWLVILFPELTFRFPWLLVGLLALSGSFLLAGFDRTRRQAEAARHKALGELRERQSLLETMQVPLVVVDPNSDRVIFGNRAARDLGIDRGSCIGEKVDTRDPLAREHYRRMQVVSEETRRAYGVPLELRSDGAAHVRHVIVRSVAVAAPIETFRADERHRLAVLFVVDPEADLPIFSRQLEAHCRDDERRRLAGLLSHGVDTLARVLRHRLEIGSADLFDRWLADYLGRRLEVCAWLFEHWRDQPPLPPEASLGPTQVAKTLERLVEVLTVARDSPRLRTRLGWANGTLSLPSEGPPVCIDLQWPETYLVTSPVRGGVGFFLEELLVNAIAHGAAGSRPEVSIRLDPVRRELQCHVTNEIDAEAGRRPEEDLEPYGGRRIVARLARLFGWRDLRFDRREGRFVASWEIPVSEGPEPGADD